MKIKINWKELGKQLWDAVKPVLLGALGQRALPWVREAPVANPARWGNAPYHGCAKRR